MILRRCIDGIIDSSRSPAFRLSLFTVGFRHLPTTLPLLFVFLFLVIFLCGPLTTNHREMRIIIITTLLLYQLSLWPLLSYKRK